MMAYTPPPDPMADCWREVIAQYDQDVANGVIKPWDPDNPEPIGATMWTEHAGHHVSLLDREP